MTDALLEWRNYRYFPYERDFARLETERLFGTRAHDDAAGIRIAADAFRPHSAERLTYFARAVHANGNVVIPRQAQLEASARGCATDRQATRYSAHALHEYKGRFNPQVVRAIGNIMGLGPDAWVLDPFCGSGTTLLESLHAGWNAVGIDRNPLAVRIAGAKLHAVRRTPEKLMQFASAVVEGLERFRILSGDSAISDRTLSSCLGAGWEGDLPALPYLRAWFPRSVLAQIVAIRRVLGESLASSRDRAVFEVILSDHLREASLQEPLDLRVRRRKEPQENYPLIELFADAVEERLARVCRARHAIGAITGHHSVTLGDTRALTSTGEASMPHGGFDAVITSPPYETALPYIDTQRLSLVLLGDVDARALGETEQELIGAREISTRERRVLEEQIKAGNDSVPHAVLDLCRELLAAAALPENGFRRRNRPALTYRYFANMGAFFAGLKGRLRPGAPVALVVGTNRTTLGGNDFVIDTPQLLRMVAEQHGYSSLLERRMDTYPRYDLHQRNAIDSETLIVVSAP